MAEKWLSLVTSCSLSSGCIPSDEQVRVCPSIKSRRGFIWSKTSFSSKHWMIDVSLRVTGRLKTGADGLVSGPPPPLTSLPSTSPSPGLRLCGSRLVLDLREWRLGMWRYGMEWGSFWTLSTTMARLARLPRHYLAHDVVLLSA